MSILRSKVVAIVLTLTMVLSIIATPFVNAANDVVTTNSAAAFLQEKGLLVGDNGDLMLDQTLTREQATVAMSRLLGIEAEAETYSTEGMTFVDVDPTGYYGPFVAWAQDNGYVQGYSEEIFGFGDSLTAWQTKALFVRALGFIDIADGDINAKADELGITIGSTADDNAAITRADMALLMYNTVHATNANGEVLGEVLGVLEPEETVPTMTVSAASNKTFKAVFSAEVDSAAAKFDVKKDDLTAKVSSVTWNDEKTEATLTMSSKLSEGKYTITVSGIEVEEASATVKIEDEATGKIEFTTDKAILYNSDADKFMEGFYTYYKVYNQYGEDVTEEADIDFSASKADDDEIFYEDGRLLIVGEDVYEEDDIVTVSALDKESGVFATATLTVVEEAAPDEVEIVKLYCDDEDAEVMANDDDPDSDVFKLLLRIKDQYGNVMSDNDEDDFILEAIRDGLTISSSKTSRVDLTGDEEDDIYIDEIDDEKYAVVDLEIGDDDGTATIRITSNRTGKRVSYDIEVLPEESVDKVTLTLPEIAVIGEEIKIEMTAVNESGKNVTDISTLEDDEKGITVDVDGLTRDFEDDLDDPDTNVKIKKEGGKLYLILDTQGLDNDDMDFDQDNKDDEYERVTLTVETATGNSVTKSFNVYEEAVPTKIEKLVDVKTGILLGNKSTIEVSDDEDENNIQVVDQYDRVVEWVDVFPDYSLRFDVASAAEVSFADGAELGTTALTTFGEVNLFGEAKGSEKVTITLVDDVAGEDVDDSEYEFNVTVVELKDIKSFEVEDVDAIYATPSLEIIEAALDELDGTPNDEELDDEAEDLQEEYAVEVKVNGIASGKKVEIPADMFSVVASLPGTTIEKQGLVIDDEIILAPFETQIPFETNKETLNGKITVTIGGHDGPEIIEKAVVVSKVVPVADKITVDDTVDVEIDGLNATVDDGDCDVETLLATITVKDQYGVENPLVVPKSIIFSNKDDASGAGLALTNGAIGTAEIDGAAANDTFTMTVTYGNGKSVSINVTVE